MKRVMGVAILAVVLLLAPVALAGPLDGWTGGVLGWWADAWSGLVVAVFGASSESESEPIEEPEAVEPVPTTDEQDACSPLIGCTQTDGGPGMDPDG